MKAMKYYGILPERKLWVKIAALILGVLSSYQALVHQNWFFMPFGLVVILASFSERKQVVSDQGVDIEYRVLGHCFQNLWTYEEIQAIHKDSLKSAPRVEVHFNKGAINRRFIFSPEDARGIEDLVREKLPKMKILEVNHRK
nr:hypothetical protein [Urinicoccus massiliensis]